MEDKTTPEKTVDSIPKLPSMGDMIGQGDVREMIKTTVKKLGSQANTEEKKEQAKALVKIFEKGMSPMQALNFTTQEVSVIYSYAFHLFNSGKIEEARELFKILYLLNPQEPGLATALGVCHHRLNAYDHALTCYMAEAHLNPLDPVPLFYAYDIYMKQNEKAAAKLMLYNVIGRGKDNGLYTKMCQKAELLLDALEQQGTAEEQVKPPTE